MTDAAELERRIADLERRLANLVRVGRVSAASSSGATAQVVFDDDSGDDEGEAVTHDLPVLQQRTKGSRDYHVLQPEEQVLCLFLPAARGGEQGFVLGCHYSEAEAPPLDDAAARVIAGGDIRLTSETAAQKYVRGDAFKTLFDAHTHPTPAGPSGPPIALHRIDVPGSPGAPHLSTQIRGE